MIHFSCTFALALTFATCCAIHADEIHTQELKSLNGVWLVKSLETDGRKTKDGDRRNLRFEFASYKLPRMEDGERDGEMTFVVQPEKSPKWMDVVEEDGRRVKAIYELNGNSLTLCFRLNDQRRAEAFDGSKGTFQVLVKMERIVEDRE